jgi:hypothetical protein
VAPAAFAGSPHCVSNTLSATRTGNTLVVEGKEAGLGNEEQVDIVVTATAECINKGEKHPKAANKESLSEEGTFPRPERQGELLAVRDRVVPAGMCAPDDGRLLKRHRRRRDQRHLQGLRQLLGPSSWPAVEGRRQRRPSADAPSITNASTRYGS